MKSQRLTQNRPLAWFVNVYRNGLCPEMFTCGFNKTPVFKKELDEYLKGFENQVYRGDSNV